MYEEITSLSPYWAHCDAFIFCAIEMLIILTYLLTYLPMHKAETTKTVKVQFNFKYQILRQFKIIGGHSVYCDYF